MAITRKPQKKTWHLHFFIVRGCEWRIEMNRSRLIILSGLGAVMTAALILSSRQWRVTDSAHEMSSKSSRDTDSSKLEVSPSPRESRNIADLNARALDLHRAVQQQTEEFRKKDPIADEAFKILERFGRNGMREAAIFEEISAIKLWCSNDKLQPEQRNARLASVAAYRRYKVIESYDVLLKDDHYSPLVRASLQNRNAFDAWLESRGAGENVEKKLEEKWQNSPLVTTSYPGLPPGRPDLLDPDKRQDLLIANEGEYSKSVERVPRDLEESIDRWVVRDVLSTCATVYLIAHKPVELAAKEEALNGLAKAVRRQRNSSLRKKPEE